DDWRSLPRGITPRAVERATAQPTLVETFEDYDVGETPLEVADKEGAAEAVVTDREPASGTRCLRFVDAAEAAVWKPHWCVERTPASGTVRMHCALKNDLDQPATIGLEFRDWAGGSKLEGRYFIGPSLRFTADGTVQAVTPGAAGWMTVGRYDLGRWLRVEVEFEEGAGKPKTYTLRLTGPDGATATKDGLTFCQPEFEACAWCGFVGIDAKPAVFYVDDIRLE
ncbi:MAG: hypothetical protein ACKOEM_09105, partial [Planctomycetia bacterium]